MNHITVDLNLIKYFIIINSYIIFLCENSPLKLKPKCSLSLVVEREFCGSLLIRDLKDSWFGREAKASAVNKFWNLDVWLQKSGRPEKLLTVSRTYCETLGFELLVCLRVVTSGRNLGSLQTCDLKTQVLQSLNSNIFSE